MIRYPLIGISRHRLGIDGKGVTSLVCGAGCPLRCRYCINKKLLAERKPEMVSPQELYVRVKRDDLYYRATGGGITFGGGESLLQASFYGPFRKICGESWQINAETSLAVPREQVEIAAESVDEFIVDCKDLDPDVYHRYTGGEESLMEDNLRFLLKRVGPDRIVVRVPLIPDHNTAESREKSIEKLTAMGVTRLDVFSYQIRDHDELYEERNEK